MGLNGLGGFALLSPSMGIEGACPRAPASELRFPSGPAIVAGSPKILETIT